MTNKASPIAPAVDDQPDFAPLHGADYQVAVASGIVLAAKAPPSVDLGESEQPDLSPLFISSAPVVYLSGRRKKNFAALTEAERHLW